jgi:hypothetical protein
MRLLLSIPCVLSLGLSLAGGTIAASHPGAKVLFYDPTSGGPSFAAAPPSAATGLTPVGTSGVSFVGVHYWFEDDRGAKFARSGDAGIGAHVRLHLRGNVDTMLTVWMSDQENASLELTPRSSPGPAGQWTGYHLPRDQVYLVPRELIVAEWHQATHILVLLARSQTEQVNSVENCRAKLLRIQGLLSPDGEPELIQEVDRSTPGQIGTYVVRRSSSQTGAEILVTH